MKVQQNSMHQRNKMYCLRKDHINAQPVKSQNRSNCTVGARTINGVQVQVQTYIYIKGMFGCGACAPANLAAGGAFRGQLRNENGNE